MFVEIIKHSTEFILPVFVHCLGWELNVKLQNEVPHSKVSFYWAEWIIVQDWHSFAGDDLVGIWIDHIVYADFDLFVLDGLELNRAGEEGII